MSQDPIVDFSSSRLRLYILQEIVLHSFFVERRGRRLQKKKQFELTFAHANQPTCIVNANFTNRDVLCGC